MKYRSLCFHDLVVNVATLTVLSERFKTFGLRISASVPVSANCGEVIIFIREASDFAVI